ncbi:MAG: amidohydrolase family protein [Opitutales bacterium]|nr:amidohydrolase family protein [Opitutales bacterium]
MNDLIIKNAVVGNESGSFCEIAVKNGRIARISRKIDENAESVFDAGGAFLGAGFIDCHFHGAGGFDFCDGDFGALCEIAKLKLKEGVTGILPATLSLPFENLEKSFECAKKYEQANLPSMPRIFGVHLEGPFLNQEMAGAQNPEFLKPCEIGFVKRLNGIFRIKKISYAPELDLECKFLREVSEMGIFPSSAHSSAGFGVFSNALKCGLKGITHFGNRQSPITSRDIGSTGAGLLFDDVWIEIVADKKHLSEDMLKLVFAKKNFEKIILITDSMRASWLGEGVSTLGGLKVIVKNGEARLCDGGALAGSVLKMNDAVKNFAEISGEPVLKIAECASKNVAESLGLGEVGRIEENCLADFTLLDENASVLAVFVGGKLCFKA